MTTAKMVLIYVVATAISAVGGTVLAPKIHFDPCEVVYCHGMGGPK